MLSSLILLFLTVITLLIPHSSQHETPYNSTHSRVRRQNVLEAPTLTRSRCDVKDSKSNEGLLEVTMVFLDSDGWNDDCELLADAIPLFVERADMMRPQVIDMEESPGDYCKIIFLAENVRYFAKAVECYKDWTGSSARAPDGCFKV